MSCEYRRRKFLGLLVSGGYAAGAQPSEVAAQVTSQVTALERIYQQAYDAARARREEEKLGAPANAQAPGPTVSQELENRRKMQLLFGHMLRLGVPLPVHSSSGVPKPEAQAGYAALWDTLKTRIAEDGRPSSTDGVRRSSVESAGWVAQTHSGTTASNARSAAAASTALRQLNSGRNLLA